MLSQGPRSLGHVEGEGSGPQERLDLAERGTEQAKSRLHACIRGPGLPQALLTGLGTAARHASGVPPSKARPAPLGAPTPLEIQSALLS